MTNRLIACVGSIAEKPFYFEKVYANIYSIEELCYVLYENAFLIDKDILDVKLVEWIDTQCKLHDLATNLYTLINTNGLPASFVGTILEYVGLYTKDEIEKAESILKMNVTMNVFEKWKAKADFLYENRHFLLAIKEYKRVLSEVNEDDFEIISKVYNNMGVTYMALYLYDSAIECFKKAFEISNDKTAYKHYLAAMRLKLTEDEYIRLVADEEDAYKMSVSLETEFEECKARFEESDIANRLKETFALKDSDSQSLYYEELTRLTESLKNDYRDIALEAETM